VVIVYLDSVYVLVVRFTSGQLSGEISFYALVLRGFSVIRYSLTLQKRRRRRCPSSFIHYQAKRTRCEIGIRAERIVLATTCTGKPWLWPMRLGHAGRGLPARFGKDHIIKDIIPRVFRTWGPPNSPAAADVDCRWQADNEYLAELLPAIETAGRMHQLRVLNPLPSDIPVALQPIFR